MRIKRMGVWGALAAVVIVMVAGAGRDSAPVVDCEICAQAQRCCESVAPGHAVCTFSEAKCSSMSGDGRAAYVNACLTFLKAVRGTWPEPPAECR